jgi:hypothetical protein
MTTKCFVFWDDTVQSDIFIDVSFFPFPFRYLTMLSVSGIHRGDDQMINEYGGVEE